MRILIARHAEPDYTIDSLTPKGDVEAELLSKRLKNEKIDYFYLSPLGRAQRTASFTLPYFEGVPVETKDWLREFHVTIQRPDRDHFQDYCWDWMPEDWVNDERFYSVERWHENEVMAAGNAKAEYDRVCNAFDGLLAKHGYERDGKMYRAVQPNHDTICIFAHFGLECVLLSHLSNISPMLLWHHFVAAPSSLTVINTEEREEGKAVFRTSSFGDTSHLYAGNEPASFAARYCECFSDEEKH